MPPFDKLKGDRLPSAASGSRPGELTSLCGSVGCGGISMWPLLLTLAYGPETK